MSDDEPHPDSAPGDDAAPDGLQHQAPAEAAPPREPPFEDAAGATRPDVPPFEDAAGAARPGVPPDEDAAIAAAPAGVSEPAGPRPAFQARTTAIWGGIVTAIIVVARLFSSLRGAPETLEHPAQLAVVHFGRLLEMTSAGHASNPLTRLFEAVMAIGGAPLPEAIDAYRTILTAEPGADVQARDALRGHLAVALAEADRWDECQTELTKLAAGSDIARQFAATTRYAYAASDSAPAPSGAGLELLAPPTQPPFRGEWTRNRLQARVARRAGDTAGAAALDARLEALSRHWERVVLGIVSIWLVSAAATPILVFLWLRRRRPRLRIADAALPPPWFTVDGYATLLWGSLLSALAALPLDLANLAWHGIESALGWLSSLPMLHMIRSRLLRPYDTGFRRNFGLVPRPGRWPLVLALAAVFVTIDLIGTFGLTWLRTHFGSVPLWSEGVFEDLAWGSHATVLFRFGEIACFAPILEELVLRGVLYGTLRRHWRPLPSMLVSGAVFGFLHPYDWWTAAGVALGGVWLALVYEKSRSLLPGILMHACSNAIGVVAMCAIYRPH